MAKNPFPLDQAAIEAMLVWARQRISQGPDPRAGAQDFVQLEKSLGGAITADGMDDGQAFALFSDVIVPSTRPMNHPTSLSFVAAAPTPASLGFDAALSSAEIFAGNWDGASGAIYAENQALAWLAELAGWPAYLRCMLLVWRSKRTIRHVQRDGEFCAASRHIAVLLRLPA